MTTSRRLPTWQWDPEDYYPLCDRCTAFARWSVGRFETADSITRAAPIIRWFACGQHLSPILSIEEWWLDSVMIYDLTQPPAGS